MRKKIKNNIKKSLLLMAILTIAINFSSCRKEQKPEDIVYGEIDFDVEEVKPKKPNNLQPSNELIGTTYLNLLQGGLFCEDDENLYYVITYNKEKCLVKENKESSEQNIIYTGEIRNIFVINGWIYGIIKNYPCEQIIVMDIDGYNMRYSDLYKKEIRTMMSNGEKIYFTVDASNIIYEEEISSSLHTGIYSYDMDLTNLQTEKLTDSLTSQVDLISIIDGYILFNETNGASSNGKFESVEIPISEKPIIYNDNVYVLDDDFISDIIGHYTEIKAKNMINDCLYFSIYENGKNFIFCFNINTREHHLFEIEKNIIQIYETSDGVLLYDGTTYMMRKENVLWEN